MTHLMEVANGYCCGRGAIRLRHELPPSFRRVPLGEGRTHRPRRPGTAATNPDFDHLLRGTVHDPTTRRMGGVAGQAGVFSTADDVALFAQALLDRFAGRPSNFPLKRETLELMTTPQQPKTAQSGATIFTQDGTTTTGVAQRGFGWDINSAYSRPRGTYSPPPERKWPVSATPALPEPASG